VSANAPAARTRPGATCAQGRQNKEIADMARTPNYSFERMERERAKAAKAAEKAQAVRERREQEAAQKSQSTTGDHPDSADDV
jgi:hypothetical protein